MIRRIPAIGFLTLFAGFLIVAAPSGSASARSSQTNESCFGTGTEVSCTFSYDGGATGSSGTPQRFVVPGGVTHLTIEAWGAEGGNTEGVVGTGGRGGYSKGTVSVIPGDVLFVRVGGMPTTATGGYNGGGASGPAASGDDNGSGGGASDVRLGADTLADRILIGGGGGGGATAGVYSSSGEGDGPGYEYSQGGSGGGATAGIGEYCGSGGPYPACGAGGTATEGGAAGPSTGAPCAVGGDLGSGGSGCGGGGGGGLYGGGGGGYYDGPAFCCTSGTAAIDNPGGGGSGFVTPSATGAATDAGLEFGNGTVRISYQTTGAPRGLSWTSPAPLEAGVDLTGVSCPTTKFCVAVDSTGRAATYRRGVWSPFEPVSTADSFTSVSCASSTFCAAVGAQQGTVADDYQTDLAVIYDNGRWSANGSEELDPGETLASVSCAPDTENCETVGWYSEGFGDGFISETYNGTSWSASAGSPGYGSPGNLLATVSCTKATSCVVGGIEQERDNVNDFLGISYHGTDGGGLILENTITNLSGWIDASGCSGDACVLAGNGNYVFTTKRATWSGPSAPDALSTIEAISCGASSTCMAVDNQGNVLTDKAGAWSAPLPIDPDRSLSSISCPTTRFCVAVDAAGNVMTAS
jgi:hypothetical protein